MVEKGPEAFRTISEVAEDLDLPQHVLRFWETRFNQIKPLKRGGGRRYYRPDDVDLLCGIRLLLYGEGYTIKGVQRLLKEKGVGFIVEVGRAGSVETVAAGEDEPMANGEDHSAELVENGSVNVPARSARPLSNDRRKLLESALSELLEVKRLLDRAGARSST
ncbi:MAG TPA: MerR family transcriptional regulator [Afifellaceae bacterium]|nr:MerR family transcriptional regulator [Afifellaceae bacterium]